VPGSMARVHALNSMVHQQFCIELRHTGCGRNSSEALTKIRYPTSTACLDPPFARPDARMRCRRGISILRPATGSRWISKEYGAVLSQS
jgi:hypothetical protein